MSGSPCDYNMSRDISVRTLQMLVHRRLVRLAVVERNHFVEEILVAGLANVATYAEHKPKRIVIEI